MVVECTINPFLIDNLACKIGLKASYKIPEAFNLSNEDDAILTFW
jgi:hypothetical protein